jgi:uncharacterized protein YciI
LTAYSEAEAHEIVDHDPAVVAGVFKGELKLFRLALIAGD